MGHLSIFKILIINSPLPFSLWGITEFPTFIGFEQKLRKLISNDQQKSYCNKKVHIKYNVHDTFLESPSSGTLKYEF